MSAQVVCFGEMLWDLLPSGEQPGGAPMNVAYHLKKLGLEPAMISRVGDDDYGRRLLGLLDHWRLSAEFIQMDPEHQTGMVHAYLNERQEASYEIVQPVAWDFIEWEERLVATVQQADLFIYGSLSARSEVSRNTLLRLLQHAKTRVFDVNIRWPHFQKDVAEQLIAGVDVLKLNEHELPVLAGWIREGGSLDDQVISVQEYFNVPLLVVTRGGDGAVLRTGGKTYQHPGYKVEVADTVGSGDAFLAGLLSRLHRGDDPGEALAFACATGALIATHRGACPDYDPAVITRLMAGS